MRQALDITASSSGEDNLKHACFMNNLAELYRARGDYAAAEPLMKQALEIVRHGLGEGHADFAQCLSNLAGLLQAKGDYAAAEPLYRHALEIRGSALGKHSTHYGQSLNNLAVLYININDLESAQLYLEEALQIYRDSPTRYTVEYAQVLENLASVHDARDEFAVAESLYQEVLETRSVVQKERHPIYGRTLNRAGVMCAQRGYYEKAEAMYRQAQEVYREALGERHQEYATCLTNRAVLYDALGKRAQAELLFVQALEIFQSTLGDGHQDYAGCLCNLALLYAATGRRIEAMESMLHVASIDDAAMGNVFRIASEHQRELFVLKTKQKLDIICSLLRMVQGDARIVHRVFDLVLRRKAITAEALAVQRESILGDKYPELKCDLRHLCALRMQTARKTLDGPGPEGIQAHESILTEWGAKISRLETDLARRIPEMNLEQRLVAADRQAVASRMPHDAVLVEFIRFMLYDFEALPSRHEPRWRTARYLAFVLRAGPQNQLQFVDLGEAVPIDRMIASFRASILDSEIQSPERDMVKAQTRSNRVQSNNQTGCALREMVFDKFAVAFREGDRVFISPDGDLARLPFGVLPTDDGRHLSDEFEISYVSCGREVIRFGGTSGRESSTPLVICDPDFDLRAVEGSPPSQGDRTRGRCSRDLNDAEYHFDRLPATRLEGQRIGHQLGVTPWQSADALEGRLKGRCRSPRILHLATHGFFLEDQQYDHASGQRGLGLLGDPMGGPGRLAGPLPENPLLRSGLALAGANTWLRKGELPAEAEDGLLTAEDVTGLDLLDTELVVLSACDTGLGEIRVGEGVFGLRRAFVLAGAKTLIMSLWKVPDEPTRELMEDFYHRIMAGQGRAGALREAQLALKAKYPEPFYWGAFISQEDPGPLEGHRAARQRPAKKIDEREFS